MEGGPMENIGKENHGPFKRFMENIRYLNALIKDYWRGDYREVPLWVIATICFAILYLLKSFHLIPHVLPVFGMLDVIVVIVIDLYLIDKETCKLGKDIVPGRIYYSTPVCLIKENITCL